MVLCAKLIYDYSDMGLSDWHNRGLGYGSRESRDVLAAVQYLTTTLKPDVEKACLRVFLFYVCSYNMVLLFRLFCLAHRWVLSDRC